MTIPSERFRAIANAREFLYALLDPKKTPRVPTEIRQRARHCLRHFPSEHYMEEARELAPKVFKDDF